MDVTQAIPDELVELILLRLDATASLLRAASTCQQWCRVAADAVFLRRFRSLHPPTVAGSYYSSTKFAPSPAVSGAIDASHFSLGFLKHLYWCSWTIMDSRGGLLLLDRGFQRLIVCEPLTRRHMRIPPLAGFAAAAGHDLLRAYLADGEEDEAGARVSMSNFRVVHEFYRRGARAAVFDFTAGGRGAGGSRCSWKEMDIGHAVGSPSQMRLLGRAGGLWYLYSRDGRLVEFDGGTAEFSSSSPLPPAADENWDSNYRYLDLCFAEGRDGKPRVLSTCDFGRTLKVIARLDDGGSGCNGEWAVEKRIPMSEATREQLMGYEYEPSLLRQWLYMRQGIKNIFRYELPWPPVMRVGIGIGR